MQSVKQGTVKRVERCWGLGEGDRAVRYLQSKMLEPSQSMIVFNFGFSSCHLARLNQSLSEGASEAPPGGTMMIGHPFGNWIEPCHSVALNKISL